MEEYECLMWGILRWQVFSWHERWLWRRCGDGQLSCLNRTQSWREHWSPRGWRVSRKLQKTSLYDKRGTKKTDINESELRNYDLFTTSSSFKPLPTKTSICGLWFEIDGRIQSISFLPLTTSKPGWHQDSRGNSCARSLICIQHEP